MTFLDNIEMLNSLTEAEKNKLAAFCQERMVKKGEVLFNEGDEANAMYILKTGAMGIYKYMEGEDVYLGDVRAEEIVGEMALFSNNGVRMAKAVATEDSAVITILSFSINELTKNNPAIMTKINQIIQERTEHNKILEEKVKRK